jgi:hypothetical protein
MKINTTLTILLLLPLLTGCWGITLESDTPTEYIETKKTIESFYGSTQEDIIRELGEPEWIEKRGGSTYFIYQWKRSDKGIVFVILPIPVGGGRLNANLYCLLLEFDEGNHLINHESVRGSDDNVHLWMEQEWEVDCIDIISAATRGLTQEIGIYCPNADLGQADAQMRIGDIFYLGRLNVEINLSHAYVWYSLAIENGGIVASGRLNEVEKKMSSEQLTEAKRLLRDWEPGHCENDLLERHRALIKIE